MSETPKKLALPYAEITPAAADVVAQVVSEEGRKTQRIKLSLLKHRPNFNILGRTEFEIIELAHLILASGYIEPLKVDIIDINTVYIDEGNRRLAAMLIIEKWGRLSELNLPGPDKDLIECFINGPEVTELDRNKRLISSNTVAPLDFNGRLHMLNRFRTCFGITKHEDLANVMQMSRQSVENLLLLEKQPDYMHSALNEGVITPTAAVILVRKEKDETTRQQIIDHALNKGIILTVKDIERVVSLNEPVVGHKIEDDDEDVPRDEFDAYNSIEDTDTSNDHVQDDDNCDDGSEDDESQEIPTGDGYVVLPEDTSYEEKVPGGKNPDRRPRNSSDSGDISDVVKDELTWCTDCIGEIDKARVMISKSNIEKKWASDIDRILHFATQKLESIKEFVRVAQLPEKSS